MLERYEQMVSTVMPHIQGCADKSKMHIRQLSGYIGAVIDGIDLGHLSQTDIDAIKAAYLVHQVLFFREQTLSTDALVNLAKQFGKIQKPHPALKISPQHPDIFLIETTQNDDISKYNASWHTDVSFDATPPSASLMQAVVVPEVGGDTLYASMYAAYSNLSQRVRDMIEGLNALHDGFSRFRFQLTDPQDHVQPFDFDGENLSIGGVKLKSFEFHRTFSPRNG